MSVFCFFEGIFFSMYICVPCALRGYTKRLEFQMALSYHIDTKN